MRRYLSIEEQRAAGIKPGRVPVAVPQRDLTDREWADLGIEGTPAAAFWREDKQTDESED